MNEKVSVIIPTYNREKTIFDSVMSVVNQTYKNLEIIIYDDGSNDNTQSIVKGINDERIKYFKGRNGGAGHARNMGIAQATGDYIAFHDSDDICRPYRIQHQLDFLKETKSDMVYAQLVRYAYGNYNKSVIYPVDGGIGKTNEETYRNFLTKSSVWTQVIFCKAHCCKEILFDETLPAMEDWEWSLRFAKKYKVDWKKEVIVDSYITENSISRSSYNKMVTLLSMYEVYYNDIIKYDIKEIWDWLIAYYKYNDNPNSHFDYGIKILKLGLKTSSIKKVIFGFLCLGYVPPIRKTVRFFRKGMHSFSRSRLKGADF